jgi:hypothetical protein
MGGTVTLVAPTKLTAHYLMGRRTVSLTTLKLTYMPEPGISLLLGATVAGFVLHRRRRRS